MKSTVKHVALAATLSVAAAGFGSAPMSTADAQDVTPASGAAPVHGAAAADSHGAAPVAEFATAAPAGAHGGASWGYQGANGPDAWAQISFDYAACGAGVTQSPIDIAASDGASVHAIDFDYNITPLTIVNNGHTVQVNYAAGSSVEIAGKHYDLLQFHFHTPSEHAIDGGRAAMEAHFVHKADDGELAVIGVMIENGDSNLALEEIWQHMPMQASADIPVPQVLLNARDLLPKGDGYFRYMGSLTTPPCTEGVNWYVMQQPISVGTEQLAKFASAVGSNARPLQAQHNRLVLSPIAAN